GEWRAQRWPCSFRQHPSLRCDSESPRRDRNHPPRPANVRRSLRRTARSRRRSRRRETRERLRPPARLWRDGRLGQCGMWSGLRAASPRIVLAAAIMRPVSRRFDRFVDDLSRVELGSRACNQFARTGAEADRNAIRRRNLRLYLEELDAIGPRLLLVGEAVSHRGGRLTGIAFVSESVMLAGVDLANGARVLGEDRGYRKADLSTPRSTEASATMVWGTIRNIDPLPLLW